MVTMRASKFFYIVAAIAVLHIASCTPSEPAATDETASPTAPPATAAPDAAPVPSPDDTAEAEAAYTAFEQCIAEAERRLNDTACMDAAATLARFGGPPLENTLKRLDEPGLAPHGKLMIVEGFKGKLNHYVYGMLTAMTAPEKEAMTRLSATALLASIPDPNLVATLIELSNDPNEKLSFTALVGLATMAQEGSEFRKRLVDRYDDLADNPNMREHVIAAIAQNPYQDDETLLITGLQDSALGTGVRREAATALGRIGGEDALSALLAVQDDRAPQDFREAVELSIIVIRERMAAGDDDTVKIEIMEEPAG